MPTRLSVVVPIVPPNDAVEGKQQERNGRQHHAQVLQEYGVCHLPSVSTIWPALGGRANCDGAAGCSMGDSL